MLQQPPLQLHVLHLRLYHHQRGILGEWKVSYIWSLTFNRIMLIIALVGNMMTQTYNNVWRGLDSSIFSFSLHSKLRVVTISCKHSLFCLICVWIWRGEVLSYTVYRSAVHLAEWVAELHGPEPVEAEVSVEVAALAYGPVAGGTEPSWHPWNNIRIKKHCKLPFF